MENEEGFLILLLVVELFDRYHVSFSDLVDVISDKLGDEDELIRCLIDLITRLNF